MKKHITLSLLVNIFTLKMSCTGDVYLKYMELRMYTFNHLSYI